MTASGAFGPMDTLPMVMVCMVVYEEDHRGTEAAEGTEEGVQVLMTRLTPA